MEVIYQEPDHKIYCGHAIDILKGFPDEFVDMVITSPPYWGLRTYKTEPIIWGDNHCEHEWGEYRAELLHENRNFHSGSQEQVLASGYELAHIHKASPLKASFCLKCHVWKGELGLEPTIELYIEHLILIFNEVKRVLKKTGTCWVNLDDSYAGSTSQRSGEGEVRNLKTAKFHGGYAHLAQRRVVGDTGATPSKSLCLIPQRFAIAMVNNGWILRNDIAWNKPNPMPESVKDRFTGAWEHLFFFVKNKKYWFEQQFDELAYIDRRGYQRIAYDGKLSDARGQLNVQPVDYFGQPPMGRNKRDVWEIATEPYPEAHFATFPEKLCEIPILAGCPQNGIVLDPLTGSGTAQAVAKKLGRKSIGIELNQAYCKLAAKRLQEISLALPLFVA